MDGAQPGLNGEDLRLIEDLKSVTTIDALEKYLGRHEAQSAFAKAVAHFGQSHIVHARGEGATGFELNEFISADLSAIRYLGCPVVFLGINDWALKRFSSEQDLRTRIYTKRNRLLEAIASVSRNYAVIVVPEKDSILDAIAFDVPPHGHRQRALWSLFDGDSHLARRVVYDQYTAELDGILRVSDYNYFDSHLPARDYLLGFERAVNRLLGLPPPLSYVLEQGVTHADLFTKFGNRQFALQPAILTRVTDSQCQLMGGDETFATPLGDTVQIVENPAAPHDASIALYGDSHCSLLANRKLTYLFACLFRRCVFHWDPFRFRKPIVPDGSDFAVFEIAERFMF